MRRIGIVSVIAAALLGGSLAPGTLHAQVVTWVQTSERIGPNGCFEYVAEWSDGTYTAAVVDCGGQEVGAGNLIYMGYYEQLGPDGCREGVSYWSNGAFTWVPLGCPPGVVYVKPDWDQRAPWNQYDPHGGGRVPSGPRPSAQPPRSPATARPVPQQPAVPVAPPSQPPPPAIQPLPPPSDAPADPAALVTARTIDYLCAERVAARRSGATTRGTIQHGMGPDSPYVRLLDVRIAQEQADYFAITGQQYPLPAGCAPGT